MTDIARYSQKYNQGGTGKKAWVREGEKIAWKVEERERPEIRETESHVQRQTQIDKETDINRPNVQTKVKSERDII